MQFGASTFIWESPFGDDKLHLAQRVAGLGFDTLEICIEDPVRVSADAVRRAVAEAGVRRCSPLWSAGAPPSSSPSG